MSHSEHPGKDGNAEGGDAPNGQTKQGNAGASEAERTYADDDGAHTEHAEAEIMSPGASLADDQSTGDPATGSTTADDAEHKSEPTARRSNGFTGLMLTAVAVLGVAALFASIMAGQRYQNSLGENSAPAAGAEADVGEAGQAVRLGAPAEDRPAAEAPATKIFNEGFDKSAFPEVASGAPAASDGPQLPPADAAAEATANALAAMAKEARAAMDAQAPVEEVGVVAAEADEPEIGSPTADDEEIKQDDNGQVDETEGDANQSTIEPNAATQMDVASVQVDPTASGADGTNTDGQTIAYDGVAQAATDMGGEPVSATDAAPPPNDAGETQTEAGVAPAMADAPGVDDGAALASEIEELKAAFAQQAEEFGRALAQEREDTERQAEQIARLQTTFQDDLAARLEQTAAQIAELQSKLDGASAAAEIEAERAGKNAAAALALASLTRTLDSGAPYSNELSVLAGLAARLPAVDDLRAGAGAGVPTIALLNDRFDPFARAAIAASSREQATGPLGQLKANIDELVSVRPSEYTEGESAPAVISRAEDSMRKGDLGGAISYLGELNGAAAAAFEPWIADAEARINADSAIASLNEALLGSLNSQETTP